MAGNHLSFLDVTLSNGNYQTAVDSYLLAEGWVYHVELYRTDAPLWRGGYYSATGASIEGSTLTLRRQAAIGFYVVIYLMFAVIALWAVKEILHYLYKGLYRFIL